MRVTNNLDVSLPLAVWLLHDEYDYQSIPNYISATTLMKPLRQIILSKRVPEGAVVPDVSEFVARKLGTAIHDSIERAWKTGHKRSMKLLGYTEDVIDRVLVNPEPEELRARNDAIPVYFEQRGLRELTVNGTTYTIGGKFDMVADGIVNDFKSTSVWSYIKGTKDEDYSRQGSIYRWLHPDKITEEHIRINFVFTDWSGAMLKTVQNYPNSRLQHKDVPLSTAHATEQWISSKLALIERYKNAPESEIPECTDAELWRSEPQFKFYSDPAKANDPSARATKNFTDMGEARKFQAEKGGKGAIKVIPGEPKACGYCPAFAACSQKDRLGLGQSATVLDNNLLSAIGGN